MENQDTVKYTEIINKRFNQIGKPYSKPRVMAFMADGETQEIEEPKNTFSSMNFVLKLIMEELPGKYYVLMTKPQAIRFIRVVKQRILKTLNNNIDFINIHLSKPERAVFDIKKNGRFIEKLTHRLRDVEAKYSITDADLYRDTPAIIKKYLDTPNNPLLANSPEYKATNSPEYKVASHSDIVEKDITDFQIKLEEIDEEDKEKHAAKQEVDTPAIEQSIDSLKIEFLDLFIPKIKNLFEQYYAADLKELKETLIQHYTERLVGIRNSAHFRGSTGFQPNTTRVAERRKREQERIAKGRRNKMNAFAPTAFAPTAFAPTAFAPTAFAPTAFAPTAFAPTEVAPEFTEKPRVPVPKPRIRKKTAFNPLANAPPVFTKNPMPKPRTHKKTVDLPVFAPTANALTANAPPAFAKNPMPKPRTRKKTVALPAFAPTANALPAFAPPAFAKNPMPKPRTRKKTVALPANALPANALPAFAMPAPKQQTLKSNNPKPKVRKPRNTSYATALKAVGKRASNARQPFNQPNTSL
jgi:hypothetical protein